MPTVSVQVSDLGITGPIPAVVRLEVSLIHPIVLSAGVTTTAPFTVRVVDGVASFTVPPSPVGNGYRIVPRGAPGLPTWFVVVPDVSTISLGQLVLGHLVEPATLTPSAVPAAAWVLSLVELTGRVDVLAARGFPARDADGVLYFTP